LPRFTPAPKRRHRHCGAGPRLAADGCYPLPCAVELGLSSHRRVAPPARGHPAALADDLILPEGCRRARLWFEMISYAVPLDAASRPKIGRRVEAARPATRLVACAPGHQRVWSPARLVTCAPGHLRLVTCMYQRDEVDLARRPTRAKPRHTWSSRCADRRDSHRWRARPGVTSSRSSTHVHIRG
jgi:hypothetical protein